MPAKRLNDVSPCGIALRANNTILVESVFHGCNTNTPDVRIIHGAMDEVKPAFSEQLAAGSNSDYGLQDSKQ